MLFSPVFLLMVQKSLLLLVNSCILHFQKLIYRNEIKGRIHFRWYFSDRNFVRRTVSEILVSPEEFLKQTTIVLEVDMKKKTRLLIFWLWSSKNWFKIRFGHANIWCSQWKYQWKGGRANFGPQLLSLCELNGEIPLLEQPCNFLVYISRLESVQDFLIKLDIKPVMHLLEIRTFSLNNVIIRLAKIMNRADKN